jgi:membrane associated rhomboid family serine protease/Flp pilus assembly protein TadD
VHAEESAAEEPQQHFLVTNLLLAINIVVFVVMLLKHVPIMNPTSDQIVKWGGNFGPLTMGAQPWRLLTNIFVHIGLVHIIANMWALVVLGRLAESLYGRFSFLAIYILSGVTGSVASLLWNPMGVSAGASGALFGVVGALIATLYAGKLPLPKHVIRPILWSLVFWAVFEFAYGFWKTGVDNAAHIGGFAAGLIIGYPLGHHLGTEAPARQSRERIFTYSLMALSIFCFIVWRIDSYVVQVERARVLLVENKPDQAIALLQPALQKRPKEAYVHFLLAQSFERKNDFASGERELKQALQLAPNNGSYWRSLGELYVRNQRWEDAANAYSNAGTYSKDNGVSWFDAGIMFQQLDRSKQAAEAFKKCVAANPSFGQAWFQLGISLLNLKQNKEAVAALQQGAKLMPNNPEAHLWFGNALLSVGQEEASKAEFLKAFQLRSVQQRAAQELQQQQQQRQMQQQRQSQQPQSQPAPTSTP